MPVYLGRQSKYASKRCSEHVPPHDSKHECARFRELVLQERAGKIRDLHQQVVYELAPSVVLAGRKKPPLRYVADFVYRTSVFPTPIVVEDATGMVTPVKRIKMHLMKSVHGLEVTLV